MYTLVLLLLAVFSLYIGSWAFIRWDSVWLRNLDLIPVKVLIITVLSVPLWGSASVSRRNHLIDEAFCPLKGGAHLSAGCPKSTYSSV